MGPLLFVTLVAVLVVVIGFALYGALLGLATLGRLCKCLFWPQLQGQGPDAGARRMPAVATPVAGGHHCWDVKGCPPGRREECPAYRHPDLPCWVATMRTEGTYQLRPECLACPLFSLPALLS